MESLRKVLRQYAGEPVTLGGGGASRSAGQQVNREALQQALKELSRKNEKYFIIGVAMAAVLFVSVLVVAFLQVSQSESGLVKLASPAFGASAAVIVWRMFKTWREKSYTDCVLALVPNVDEATLKTIVAVLVKKL